MSVNTDDLRALADFLDEHPKLAERVHTSELNVFCTSADEWDILRRELGTYDKSAWGDGDTGHLVASRSFGSFRLELNVSKRATCERVQVGEREVEREVYPDDVKPTIEKVVEPVYEWRCSDSWLAPTAQAQAKILGNLATVAEESL